MVSGVGSASVPAVTFAHEPRTKETHASANPQKRPGAVDDHAGSSPAAHEDLPSQTERRAEEENHIAELRARDQEVRAHEAAHLAAGGAHVGGATYTYQQGPDGASYAVGGEVPVDVSAESGDPQATIAKMQQVRAAALAPADPSAADQAVAAAAAQKEAAARAELLQQNTARAAATYAHANGRPRTGTLVEASG